MTKDAGCRPASSFICDYRTIGMKEVRDFYEQFDVCREHDIPLCADACPFKMDVLSFRDRIISGRFNAAYKTFRDCVAFPGIVAEICPAYCRDSCVRSSYDEAVQLRHLEKAVVALADRRDPNAYNLPARKEKIAVVGGGISGMAFALKMASRKYHVTVFEKNDRIGGQLASLMDESVYMPEFELQFKNEKYTLRTSVEAFVDSLTGELTTSDDEVFDDFAVIYIATGRKGNDFGVDKCIKAGDTAIFTGGSLLGKDIMHALADGINISACADSFIKTGVPEYPAETAPSGCIADEDLIEITPAVSTETVYSEEECQAEAARCISCQCNACEKYCDLIDYYDKWPIKMRDEIFLSVKPAGSLVHKCPSRKYIAACTECGILENVCPENIDLCGMIKSARHQMHGVDKMPAAYRQYYLRDMDFANGEYAAIVRRAPACSVSPAKSPYAFFPGCNLGALNPEYVIRPYRWLLDKYPGTGLLLKCCSVPVDWAGNTEAHEEEINNLRADWEDLGKPVLITACMSCQRHLNEFLPEIETLSFYELFARQCEIKADTPAPDGEEIFTVFDPCAARGNVAVQTAVRDLAVSRNLHVEELPKNDMHGCCGFGGQGAIAQPDFAAYVAEKRVAMSDNPYLVYCSNCRDVFTGEGKKAVHILDVLFDIDPSGTGTSPGVTDRRVNRVLLKERLLKEIWSEEMISKPEAMKYNLVMNSEIANKVEHLHVLKDDICNVITRAEETGRMVRSPETGHYKAYNEIGAITLWVEFSKPDDSSDVREIHNVYSHRMQIKLEAVFNGKKID